MPEYNFWDDRTHEMNDSYWCPYIGYYCLEQSCATCEDKQSFDSYYEELFKKQEQG